MTEKNEEVVEAEAETEVEVDVDEFCDPNNPTIITYNDVLQAAQSIRPFILRTPCMAAHTHEDFGIYVHYKLDFLQHSGCFKERGTLYCLQQLEPIQKQMGVIIAATGNEALGLCYHAKKLRIPTKIVVPVTLPLCKIQRIKSLGGEIIFHGDTLADALLRARQLAKEMGLVYINVRDHPNALAGFGTLALELLEQAPFVDAILVPVGTGALAAAVATVVKRQKSSCLVYGVESENIGLLTKSLEKGEPMSNEEEAVGSLAGNALSVNVIGVNAFANVSRLVDKVLLVKEDWIARAMLHLAEREKFIVEGTAACTLAAILGGLVPELKQKNVVCLLTGGNIDSLVLSRSLQRGLAAEGRLIKFKVRLCNTVNAKAELLKLIGEGGYNILTHFTDNYWIEGDTYHPELKFAVEATSLEHAWELKRIIEREYPGLAEFENEPFNIDLSCPCYA